MTVRRGLLTAAVVLGAGALVATGQPALAAAPTSEPRQTQTAPTVPDRYLNQVVNWASCFPGGVPDGLPPSAERLECASFTAPRNWDDTAAQVDVRIAVSRLPASDGTAEGATFTNPGGPGAPGRTLPLIFDLAGRERLVASQDIYGIDPRGTGASTSVTCRGGSTTGAELDPRDRSRDNIALLQDSAALIAQFCQTGGGELGPFVRTDQTVKDLDLLRALIDREKINWVGYSGGSWMGAYYATYFPHRVGRFVLDANTAFTEPWEVTFGLQPLAFQRRYEQDFLPWAAAYDTQLDLGASAEAVDRTYEDLRAALAARPLELPTAAIYPVTLDGLILQNMYSKTSFQSLAETIRVLRDAVAERDDPAQDTPLASSEALARVGEAAARVTERQAATGGVQPLAPDSYSATFTHILCNDTTWSGTKRSLLRESERQGRRYPLVGWGVFAQPCISWDRPDVELLTPDGEGVPPVLMVQNDRDPATAVEGARMARANFEGARLLTVTNEGDHGTYAAGTPNDCVSDIVESYLVDGVVPTRDRSCPGTPIPAPVPSGPATFASEPGIAGTPQQRNEELARLAGW